MENTKLVGYSIEVSAGKLVVTVEGLFAEGVLNRVKEQLKTGRGLGALMSMAPIRYLSRLASEEVAITENSIQADDSPPDASAIFSQKVDLDYKQFVDQLAQLEANLKSQEDLARKSQAAKPGSGKPGK